MFLPNGFVNAIFKDETKENIAMTDYSSKTSFEEDVFNDQSYLGKFCKNNDLKRIEYCDSDDNVIYSIDFE